MIKTTAHAVRYRALADMPSWLIGKRSRSLKVSIVPDREASAMSIGAVSHAVSWRWKRST